MKEDNMEELKKEFMAHEISYIDTILQLQRKGWRPEDAEDHVHEWEKERRKHEEK